MSTLQERFALAIKHYEATTNKRFVKAHLADFCGVSRPAVSGWIEENTQTLEQNNAEKAARFLGVNHRWLNGLGSSMLDDVDSPVPDKPSQYKPVMVWEAPEDLDPNTYVIIPHVDVKFSAGDGRVVEIEPTTKGYGTAQLWEWVQKKRISPKNLITVDIDGDSMEPKIPNGSVVTLDKSINTLDQVQSGKVYAIRYGNELKIKRLSKRFDGALIIDSDNPDYDREIVEVDQLEHISIIGKYVSHSYDGEI
jgi:phage repressor protein C with HTH and peptisase S24 domain